MALLEIPVWPFPPDWSSRVSETLEWVTDILQSPTGSEQRRSIRFFPRKTLDFSVTLWDSEATFLDNLLMSYSAGDWYLPIWYETIVTSEQSTTTFIPCQRSPSLRAGGAIFIAGDTPFDYQIAEVASVSTTGITVTAPLNRLVTPGTLVYPMTTGRLIEQPVINPDTDATVSLDPQFLLTEAPVDSGQVIPDGGPSGPVAPNEASGLTNVYRNFYVLTDAPDWTDSTERGQDRLLVDFDNNVNIPDRIDTALRPFPTQKMQWLIETTPQHNKFYNMLQILRGRCTALWVPTWMQDMRLAVDVAAGASTIQVQRCGFTLAGGPRPERQDIVIETVSGELYFRRITGSTASSTRESLALSSALPSALAVSDVARIMFISLMRLDHDSIQIDHLTDMTGISEVQLTFRSAPNSRQPLPGFAA